MNFVKRSSERGGTRGEVKILEGVRALSMLASDLPPGSWALASLFCSMKLTKKLTQGLYWMVQDPGAIAKD